MIGTALHAGIEWHLRTQPGNGCWSRTPRSRHVALESWKDGARSCSLEPLAVERTVYCFDCGYAGTLDLYARVKGVLTVLYPEAFLQNVAYRHAAERGGLASAERLIVRLLTKSSWTIPRGRSCPFRTRRRSTSPLPRCTSGARTGAWKAIASTTTSGDVAVRVALQEEPLSRFMIMSDRASTIPDITPAIAESRTHDDAAARFLAQFSTTCREEALHLAFKPCGPASSPIVSSRANSRGRFISAATGVTSAEATALPTKPRKRNSVRSSDRHPGAWPINGLRSGASSGASGTPSGRRFVPAWPRSVWRRRVL